MANVQLLNGKDVRRALEQNNVELFRYQLNRFGYSLVLGVGALMLAGAGYLWWQTALAAAVWKAVFGGLVACGLVLSIQAAYWYSFASSRFVGVGDQKLFVGRRERVWAIDWEVLDAEALGFEQMNATAVRGALEVHVGAEQIKIHLYNAYVFLEDMQGFVFSLLKRLQDKQEQDPEDVEADDVAAGHK